MSGEELYRLVVHDSIVVYRRHLVINLCVVGLYGTYIPVHYSKRVWKWHWMVLFWGGEDSIVAVWAMTVPFLSPWSRPNSNSKKLLQANSTLPVLLQLLSSKHSNSSSRRSTDALKSTTIIG